MQEVNFEAVLDTILAKDTRYARDAYHFIREALDFTQKLINKDKKVKGRHVTPLELLDGLRQHALQQFGPMAVTVLGEWGIRSCADFGEMVFLMIESGLLAKTEQDSRAGFQAGYDFTEAFDQPYWPARKFKAAAAKKLKNTV